MVIAPSRVASYRSGQLGVCRFSLTRAQIAARETNDAFGASQDALPVQTCPCVSVVGEPRHLAVHSGGHERVVPGDVLVESQVCPGDAHGVKSEVEGVGSNAASHGTGIGRLLRVIGI
jgi:hypothetical protein